VSTPTYTTLASVKSSLDLTNNTFADSDITDAINAASRAIDQQTGQFFYQTTSQTRQFVPQSEGYCMIDPLNTFTSLVAQNSTWTLDQDFYLLPINAAVDGRPWTAIRTITRPFIFPQSQTSVGWGLFDSRIQITGLWGWTAVPDEIATATKILASRLLRRVREAPMGLSMMFGPDGSAVHIARTDPDVAALIDPYKLAVLF
jgi:hypothetical protein